MIYFNNKKWSKSLDALLKKEGFKPLSEYEIMDINKLINKGIDVYFAINPFHSEMGSGEEGHLDEFMWDTDKDSLNDLYWQLSEEI